MKLYSQYYCLRRALFGMLLTLGCRCNWCDTVALKMLPIPDAIISWKISKNTYYSELSSLLNDNASVLTTSRRSNR